MPSTFPRLVEKFGKRYSWKVMLNPRTNINERSHPRVGDLCSNSRDTYHKQWKKVLRKRERPTRQINNQDKLFSVEPAIGTSISEPKFCSITERVKNSLFKVRTPQLSELLTLGNVVGSGVEGVVRSAYRKDDIENSYWKDLSNKFGTNMLAVKTVEKRNINGCFTQQCREMEVMELLCSKQHPNITSYVYTFNSPLRFHIVTEFNQGGDLFSYLQDHEFQPLSEKDAARVLMQLFCAVQHIHESGFVHLDLKLENVMRKKPGDAIDSSGIAIIDFGHTSPLPNQAFKRLSRPVGSPSYAAPEIVLEKKYCLKSDAWSLGVIMYILLQGFLPFPHLQHKKWREFSLNDYGNFDRGIEENDPFFYESDWEDISPEARDLCQSLLQVDPNDRASVNDAILHPWFSRNQVTLKRTDTGLPVCSTTVASQTLQTSEKMCT